jgi:hypothetical protein
MTCLAGWPGISVTRLNVIRFNITSSNATRRQLLNKDVNGRDEPDHGAKGM